MRVRVQPVVDLHRARVDHADAERGHERRHGGPFPLTLASNVFVNPQTMPGWLQAFVGINPVAHLVTAARSLMTHGTVTAGQIGWVLLTSAALTAIFAPLTMLLYRNKR
jgi:ABC-2 type transport system permease protein